MKKQVTEMITQILREAEDDNIEGMTCQTEMCCRISDNDSIGEGGRNTNNVTNKEVDRKKNVLATFPLAMHAATISFMYIITHR